MNSYWHLVPHLASLAVFLGLAFALRTYPGGKWLLGSVLLTQSSKLLYFLDYTQTSSDKDLLWSALATTSNTTGIACLGFFLFGVWSHRKVGRDESRQLFSFRGRSSRAPFWIIEAITLYASTAVITTLMSDLDWQYTYQPFDPIQWTPLRISVYATGCLFILISSWIGYAASAKRFHDLGQSGWLALLTPVPFLGQLVTLCIGCIPGSPSDNTYGAPPLAKSAIEPKAEDGH